MKIERKDFLRSSAIVGTATFSALTGTYAFENQEDKSDATKMSNFKVEIPSETSVFQKLENDQSKILMLSDGSLMVKDKINKQNWDTFTIAIQDETINRESLLWEREDRTMRKQYLGRFIGKNRFSKAASKPTRGRIL